MWTEHWAIWSSCRHPSSLQRSWTRWPLKVSSNPDNSVILCSKATELCLSQVFSHLIKSSCVLLLNYSSILKPTVPSTAIYEGNNWFATKWMWRKTSLIMLIMRNPLTLTANYLGWQYISFTEELKWYLICKYLQGICSLYILWFPCKIAEMTWKATFPLFPHWVKKRKKVTQSFTFILSSTPSQQTESSLPLNQSSNWLQ